MEKERISAADAPGKDLMRARILAVHGLQILSAPNSGWSSWKTPFLIHEFCFWMVWVGGVVVF